MQGGNGGFGITEQFWFRRMPALRHTSPVQWQVVLGVNQQYFYSPPVGFLPNRRAGVTLVVKDDTVTVCKYCGKSAIVA